MGFWQIIVVIVLIWFGLSFLILMFFGGAVRLRRVEEVGKLIREYRLADAYRDEVQHFLAVTKDI